MDFEYVDVAPMHERIEHNIASAIELLNLIPAIRLNRISSLLETSKCCGGRVPAAAEPFVYI